MTWHIMLKEVEKPRVTTSSLKESVELIKISAHDSAEYTSWCMMAQSMISIKFKDF